MIVSSFIFHRIYRACELVEDNADDDDDDRRGKGLFVNVWKTSSAFDLRCNRLLLLQPELPSQWNITAVQC